MIIVCPRCGILYRVGSGELAAESRSVRCSNCDREWLHTPAAALPDSDDALRLLAASFGRDGPRPAPAPPVTRRAEAAPVAGAQRRDKEEARPNSRPQAVRVERETAPRPAPVTTLYQAPSPAAQSDDEHRSSRGVRLSSRQLDALLNSDDGDRHDADAPGEAVARGADASRSEQRTSEERGWKSVSSGLGATLREATPPEAAPAVEPARALNAAAEDEAVTVPPPPEDEAAELLPPPPARLRRPGRAVLAAGAVAATLLLSVGLLAATRGLVLAAFPGAVGFYSAVGLAPADSFAEGLEIRDVSSTRSWSDGEQILTVAGDLANVAEQPRSLPMVRVVLVDGSDAEVQEVVVVPPGETLPVGESIRFEARISNPADTAERIKVSLAPRPQPS